MSFSSPTHINNNNNNNNNNNSNSISTSTTTTTRRGIETLNHEAPAYHPIPPGITPPSHAPQQYPLINELLLISSSVHQQHHFPPPHHLPQQTFVWSPISLSYIEYYPNQHYYPFNNNPYYNYHHHHHHISTSTITTTTQQNHHLHYQVPPPPDAATYSDPLLVPPHPQQQEVVRPHFQQPADRRNYRGEFRAAGSGREFIWAPRNDQRTTGTTTNNNNNQQLQLLRSDDDQRRRSWTRADDHHEYYFNNNNDNIRRRRRRNNNNVNNISSSNNNNNVVGIWKGRSEEDITTSIRGPRGGRRANMQQQQQHKNNNKKKNIKDHHHPKKCCSKPDDHTLIKPLKNPDDDENTTTTTTTTILVKNIPYHLRRHELMHLLDLFCKTENAKAKTEGTSQPVPDQEDDLICAYDFLYLPIDFETNRGRGFAFVNFTNPRAVWRFYDTYRSKTWDFVDHQFWPKNIVIASANIQGKEALITHFSESIFDCGTNEYLPVRFDPPRDGTRQPVGVTVVGRLRSTPSRARAASRRGLRGNH